MSVLPDQSVPNCLPIEGFATIPLFEVIEEGSCSTANELSYIGCLFIFCDVVDFKCVLDYGDPFEYVFIILSAKLRGFY